MTAPDAARLHAINEQAIAILRLGIPIDLGLGNTPIDRLTAINGRLQTEAGDGSASRILNDGQVPEPYRKLAAMWLATDDPAAIFESLISHEQHRRAATTPLRRAALQPLAISVMVFLGLVYYCVFTVPQLEAQYAQMHQTPPSYTAALIQLKNTMPFWIIGVPIALAVVYFGWKQIASGPLMNWLPGARSYADWNDAEARTRSLATLLESGVERSEAMELAGPIPPSGLAATITQSQDPSISTTSRAFSLRRLSQFYRFLAEDRREVLYSKLPALLGLFLAGLIILAYGLTVFVPWIEVLRGIGSAGMDNMGEI